MDKKLSTLILALGILLLAAFLRLYGVNWDQGQHLHPDERFLTMVATGISWPKDFGEYLDTGISPLNPHNRGFGFFVYGTFPVFFTKWVAELLGKGDYGHLTIIGRQLSAMVDLGTVILVYLIAKQAISKSKFLISKKSPNAKSQLGQLEIRSIRNLPLLAMFLYSIMVLPVQLSHFYAVDTYLTFFITLSFYLLIRSINNQQSAISNIVFLGIAFGLALASKISAVLFLPIIGIGLVINLITNRNFLSFFVICCLLSVVCYLTIRLAQPYAFSNGNFFDFTLNQKVLDNWKQLKSFDDPNGWFPPGVQWIKTKPYLFPLKNIVLWGLGLPIGIISLISSAYLVLLIMYYISKKKIYLILNTKYLILFLSFFWILFLFIYQGGQFAKNMRYFIPIYPFLAIIASYFL
ncbi:glycosyltransferase family 39 protein, partial [Candidatus Gottesmanbacteria bacterium]|nr:glycosyltransferase family 39 protein [Candidatus Gottesmanbacteria bacterium]